jgi:hypothetical protein
MPEFLEPKSDGEYPRRRHLCGDPESEMRQGSREWWERHWTNALEQLKRHLEDGDPI